MKLLFLFFLMTKKLLVHVLSVCFDSCEFFALFTYFFFQIDNPHVRDDGLLSDFCDGELYKTHPLFSQDPHALQLILYFDEFEVCNPLGSRANKHKIGMFFSCAMCQVLNQYATLMYCEPISIIWNGLNCVELVYDNYILSYLTLVKMLLKIFNIFWYHIVFTHICKIAVMLYMQLTCLCQRKL